MSKQHQGSLERTLSIKQAEQHAAPSLPRPGVSRTDALLTASEVLRLQRTLGNRATGQLVQSPRHQSGSYRRITPPTTIIQPKFSFSGQDFEEAEQLLRSTPFTKREIIDGDMTDVHLEVIFGDFGKDVYGTTKMIKEEQKITIKINLTTLKEEDKDKFLGRILETFLHEWELHGLNYINGAYKGSQSQLLEHFNLVHNRHNINGVLASMGIKGMASNKILQSAEEELESDQKLHSEEIGSVGIVPIAMSQSTYDKIFDVYWNARKIIEENLEGIGDLGDLWDEITKKDVFGIFNQYFRLLFETITHGKVNEWNILQKPLTEEAITLTTAYQKFLKKLKHYRKEAELQEKETVGVVKSEEDNQISDDNETDEKEEVVELPSKRVSKAIKVLTELLGDIQQWLQRFEDREKDMLEVADLFVL